MTSPEPDPPLADRLRGRVDDRPDVVDERYRQRMLTRASFWNWAKRLTLIAAIVYLIGSLVASGGRSVRLPNLLLYTAGIWFTLITAFAASAVYFGSRASRCSVPTAALLAIASLADVFGLALPMLLGAVRHPQRPVDPRLLAEPP